MLNKSIDNYLERTDNCVSLQAYCSILYLKPRMQIILRGQKVKTQLVSKSLAYIERDIYRPKFLVSFILLVMMLYIDRYQSSVFPFPLSPVILIESNPLQLLPFFAPLDSINNEIGRVV